MLYSIAEVNTQFFAALQGVTIRDSKTGNSKPVLVRYAKMSSQDYSEEQKQQEYPCVVIADFTPHIKDDWYLDLRDYFGGTSWDGLTGYLFRRPIHMEFRFDVSIAAKSYFDFVTLKDYFLAKYQANVRFLFNRHVVNGEEVGDVVPYTIRETDIPRTDGVFEANYEFTIYPWVTPVEPKQVQLIQDIILDAEPTENNKIEENLQKNLQD